MNETSGSAQLQKLQSLRQSGAISDSEFLLLQTALSNGALERVGSQSTPLPLKHPPAYLIVLGASLFFGLYLLLSVRTSSTIAQTEHAQPEPTRAYSIGDSIQRDSIEVTIDTVETGQLIGNAFFNHRAPEGAILVAVTYSVKNISIEPVSIFGRPRLQLMDPAGVRYDEDTGASIALAVAKNSEEKLLSNLNPGITVRQSTAFEVSSSAFDKSTWMIVVDGDNTMPIKMN